MKTYSEKLKDPRWQRKRLEIMQRDGFKCRLCGADDKTLHVHHAEYRRGADPWGYPNDNFSTLCESCHESEHVGFSQTNEFRIFESLFNRGKSPRKLVQMMAVSAFLIDFSLRKWGGDGDVNDGEEDFFLKHASKVIDLKEMCQMVEEIAKLQPR